jgi:hypothetical protein
MSCLRSTVSTESVAICCAYRVVGGLPFIGNVSFGRDWAELAVRVALGRIDDLIDPKCLPRLDHRSTQIPAYHS